MKRYTLQIIDEGKLNEMFSLMVFENARENKWHVIHFNYFESRKGDIMILYFDDKHIATFKYLPRYIHEELEKITSQKMRVE